MRAAFKSFECCCHQPNFGDKRSIECNDTEKENNYVTIDNCNYR